MATKWMKPGLILAVMGLLAWYLPSSPVDPWKLLNLKKIATMIFALAFIQVLGSILNRTLGARAGAILTGFFGGLVSSTATTASLARKSKIETGKDVAGEMLIFLSATGAMLFEGIILVCTGASEIHLRTLIVFLGPLFITGITIYRYSQSKSHQNLPTEEIQFQILPILKLSVFIISILLFSKLLQNLFGQNSLIVLTFLVSLFEIHGSVIANVQLHENGVIANQFLSSLIAVSILASYLSKLFLISTLGSKELKSHAIKCSIFLSLSLLVTWIISYNLA